MKCVKKLEPPRVSENGTEYHYEIIRNTFLDSPLSDLPDFDPLIITPLSLTDGQYTYLSSRSRTFWIVSWLPESVLQYACLNCGCDNFAYIYHDKDIDDNGNPKKTHAHLLLNFSEAVYARQIAFWFRSTEIKTISYTDISKEFNYLTHNSDTCRKQKKWQYNESEIVSNGIEYWRGRCVSSCGLSEAVLMYDDFKSGISYREMLVKYGFKFLTYYCTLRNMSAFDCHYHSPVPEVSHGVAFSDENGHLITDIEVLKNV